MALNALVMMPLQQPQAQRNPRHHLSNCPGDPTFAFLTVGRRKASNTRGVVIRYPVARSAQQNATSNGCVFDISNCDVHGRVPDRWACVLFTARGGFLRIAGETLRV